MNSDSDVFVAKLSGQLIKNLENKHAILELQTVQATYRLPTDLINLDDIVAQLGTATSLESIMVHIEIAVPTANTLKVVNHAAMSGNFTLVAPAFDFTVSVTNGTKTVSVTKFNAYVERTIAILDGVDPGKITTGVVIEEDGSVRHVPTKIVLNDGQYYAKINNLTNSTYAVVWNPIQFTDMNNHWAKTAVNDMGSRMVINGTGEGNFSPDQLITRAEFAAIIVRGLGLKMENGDVPFSDIGQGDWYSEAVQTAYVYGLINGYTEGAFRPNDSITREQAMVIIAKAMAITGLKGKLPVQSTDELVQSYADADKASQWALNAIADSVQAGIVSGRQGNELAPQAFITRAEVAIMIQRLLQQSSLI
ncbi:Endo-1,4-beta-xylanase A precursor [compost metagenome]